MRGLKLLARIQSYAMGYVAPFTGAWIETLVLFHREQIIQVAPFTGAWIETLCVAITNIVHKVAPFTGAWIETSEPVNLREMFQGSHPSRVRGLKPGCCIG